jgi:hypothetical protein
MKMYYAGQPPDAMKKRIGSTTSGNPMRDVERAIEQVAAELDSIREVALTAPRYWDEIGTGLVQNP